MRIFEVNGGGEIRTIDTQAGATPALVFTGDGRFIVANHVDETIRAWRVADGKEVYRVKMGYTDVFAVSRDGRYVAFPADGDTVGIVNTETWKMKHLQKVPSDGVSSLAFHPRSRHLVSAGGDGAVHLWEIATRKHLRTISQECGEGVRVAFNRSGTRLIVSSIEPEGVVRIFGEKK